MNPLLAQIQRELQEYRGSFILVPAYIAAFLSGTYLLALIGSWLGSDYLLDVVMREAAVDGGGRAYFENGLTAGYRAIFDEVGAAVIKGTFFAVSLLFGYVVLLLVTVYLLACLYTDRKDGSILFWKSLPVSETRNLLTKLGVAVVVAPTVAALGIALSNLVFMVMISIHLAGTGAVALSEIWGSAEFFTSAFGAWALLMAYGLWFLPLYAWLLAASAWAKKAPFLAAVTPLLIAVVVERVLLGSSQLAGAIGQRLRGPNTESVAGFLIAPELWAGFVVSGLLIAGAVWLRNNRYEL